MSFQLSPELGKNKIFLVRQSELNDRLDPSFYIAVQNIKNNVTKKAKYRSDNLIKSCSINRGRFGHRPRNDPRFYNGEYPFIQTGDIVKASDNNSPIQYTQTLNDRGLKTSRLFQPPKLLFTIAANIGDTAILDYPSCFPDSVVAVIPKNEEISIEYLNIYLRLIKPYVVELAPYTAQRNLNNQQLAQVPIVIPPKEIQNQIITKMDMAYTAKKQKEAEAQDLLDSIDGCLLAELGIELPEQKENTIQRRIFTRRLSEASGGRLDPKLYDNKTKAIKEAISNTSYPTQKLKNLLVKSIAGDWGKDIAEKLGASYQKCLVIRATEFDNLFNLKLDNSRVKFRHIPKDKLKRMGIQKHDLLLEKSGGSPDQPVGRVAIITKETLKENNISYSNFIHKIRVSDQVRPEYLFCFLKTVHSINLTDAMQSQTNGIRNLIMRDYFNQTIPLPPIKKQTEIASHITSIRNQAKQLQQQAREELEQAKKEAEAMILGEL